MMKQPLKIESQRELIQAIKDFIDETYMSEKLILNTVSRLISGRFHEYDNFLFIKEYSSHFFEISIPASLIFGANAETYCDQCKSIMWNMNNQVFEYITNSVWKPIQLIRKPTVFVDLHNGIIMKFVIDKEVHEILKDETMMFGSAQLDEMFKERLNYYLPKE